MKDWHKGETVWIVGKGPSLLYLRRNDIGDGPIIAINEAIHVVEGFELHNKLYSFQKDGDPGHMCVVRSTTTIILQEEYGSEWFKEHPHRILVDPVRDMGFQYQEETSIRMAIWMAKEMGAAQIALVCCDNLVNGDVRRVDVWKMDIDWGYGNGYIYATFKEQVLNDLESIPHFFVTPKGAEVNAQEIVTKMSVIRTWLYDEEKMRLATLAQEVPAGGTIVEVGALYGGSTALLALGQPEATVHSHDNFSWSPEVPASAAFMLENLKELGIENVVIHEGDSRVTAKEWDRPIDLLWIDGGHSFEFVWNDLSTFGPHAKVIALHDYKNPSWPDIEQAVVRFLAEHENYFIDPLVVGQVVTLRRKA